MRKLAEVRREQETLMKSPLDAANQTRLLELVRQEAFISQIIEGRGTSPTPVIDGQKPVRSAEGMPKLHSALGELARRTNTRIAVDLTVKDEPTTVGVDSVTGQSVEQGLQQILDGVAKKKYKFRIQPDNTYLVYYPLSTMYMADTKIVDALATITTEVGVPIICDPNVVLNTTASYTDVPLEEALEMILTGTPYSFKRIGNYYLVGDNRPTSNSFHHLMVTRYMQLNNTTPTRMKNLLADQYKRYVQAEAPNEQDPNDQGHLLTITAPAEIADRIVELVRRFDMRRRQVLLDARVVAMENTNQLNLGVQWDFPAASYGQVLLDGNWTKIFSIGYTADEGFTNALMAKLNALQADNKLEIVANPQLTAQDGSQAELRSIREEWFMMSNTGNNTIYTNSELEKIESGTVLTITPRIGDNNEITLDFAVEVSDSIARGTESELPIVSRRQAKSRVTIKDGGTAALAGLTETQTRNAQSRVPGLAKLPVLGRLFRNDNDERGTREIAVFVTANLVPEDGQLGASRPRGAEALAVNDPSRPAGAEFRSGLEASLRNQSQ
jgi:type II secretory pathway component GspD/PulD (secretin)